MTTAKESDPELWETVEDDFMASDKGGEPGQWSAHKAQLAVQEYGRRGGGYENSGPEQDETDLNAWSDEDWGTRSGEASLDSGERYRPLKVQMLLTEEEYRRSTDAKALDTLDEDNQFSAQPADVREKVATMKNSGPHVDIVRKRARDLEIDGQVRCEER